MILLKNITYIDYIDFKFTTGNLLISENNKDKLLFISNIDEISPDTEIIDCKGKFALKSFACGHHHAYSALATGMPQPNAKLNNLIDILKNIWWKLDKSLSAEMVKISALLTAIDCAKNGCTFVIDHHSSPYSIENSLTYIAVAFEIVGISHLLSYEISDRDGDDITVKQLIETDNYLEEHFGLVGLHASFTVGNKTLSKVADLCEKYKTGIHVHVGEDYNDSNDCISKYNCSLLERYNNYGLLNRKTILAHCIHISENDRKIFNNSSSYIAYNPDSNLNNNVGFFNGKDLGNRIMLGTDGMHSDMLKSFKTSFFSGIRSENISISFRYERLRKVHNYLNNNNYEGDGENNLIIVDYLPHTEFNQENFLSHLLYSIESKHIVHVISKGKFIYKNKKLQNIDEEKASFESQKLSKELWKNMQLI